uniref:Uncharacterized protein n=1 Tax=Vibrio tasmaniensis TaxID=212663 RepID=A0A0H3ZPV7_9VIBR|nr:hypothetical protein [Vibrio tasmaniensis]
MNLFDKVSEMEVVKATSVARTRQTAMVTVTVNKTRITNSFSPNAIEKAGLTYEDNVDVAYSKDGKYLILEKMDGGLKLSHQGSEGKKSNASVRLTNKEGAYPDFMSIHGGGKDGKTILINGEIQFDKENKKMVCELKER